MAEKRYKYDKTSIDKVKADALIVDHIPDVKTSGRKVYARCPSCGACSMEKGKVKGLNIVDNEKKGMHFAKCTECGHTFGSAIDAEMHYSGRGFIDAVEACAARANVVLETDAERRKRLSREVRRNSDGSFVLKQLKASGLEVEDVMVKEILADGQERWIPAFRRGSMDVYGNISPDDDEMLIYYYDLYGKPVLFKSAERGRATRQYVRVRWAFPSNIPTAPARRSNTRPRGAHRRAFTSPRRSATPSRRSSRSRPL